MFTTHMIRFVISLPSPRHPTRSSDRVKLVFTEHFREMSFLSFRNLNVGKFCGHGMAWQAEDGHEVNVDDVVAALQAFFQSLN